MRAIQALAITIMCLLATQPSIAATQARPLSVIHYQLDDKLIRLPVRVNGGDVVWFCLDSGARHSVLDPRLVQKMGLKTQPAASVTGTGHGEVTTEQIEPVMLTLGDMRIDIAAPWAIDLSSVPIARDTMGLVGAEVLQRYVVVIDPEKRTLSIYDPKTYVRPKMAALPLIEESGRFFVDVTLDVRPGLSATHRARIDTGSGDAVKDELAAQARVTQKTILGNGLGANFEAPSGIFDAVHLGPYTFKHVWGPGTPGTLIGMEMLRRFVVTFDAPNGRLFLQPSKAFTEPVPKPS